MQSNLNHQQHLLHVGVIMDGNGRWAVSRGLPRHAGHAAGLEAMRHIVEVAPGFGISTLSLYAFSSDNWRRPRAEIDILFSLLEYYLEYDCPRLVRERIRLSVIGRRDRIPPSVRAAIDRAEQATAGLDRLHLRIALDYSARDAIVDAVRACRLEPTVTRERLAELIAGGPSAADVDLLIRTSGEQRLSDFLLWECAYAELYFTQCPWPDFGADQLARALRSFHTRQRRFGGLSSADAPSDAPCHAPSVPAG